MMKSDDGTRRWTYDYFLPGIVDRTAPISRSLSIDDIERIVDRVYAAKASGGMSSARDVFEKEMTSALVAHGPKGA